ncbi:Alcohol oxidase 1 [Psilocybe cubensis]|uniref:Alcohol oxidase 1 n=1 Tax=Psilocybe cubensis TaxID=181762 RepID=A0ACB8GHL3_PSICU|nr:Alcohol oxidase 1 [Psilocybe cubensis]KAH9475048.1 Alcohol oxidase 1 [Psilocybe cubensis]
MGHPDEVDVIVCGGGPAGCVTAGRLAYADPSLKVMLIEGSPYLPFYLELVLMERQAVQTTVMTLGFIDNSPGIFVKNMQRDGVNDKATFYVDTMQSSYLRGRQSIVPCANILGMKSHFIERDSHRVDTLFRRRKQMYTRASGSDWGQSLFNRVVSMISDAVLKMTSRLLVGLPKLENYQKPVNNDTHGYDGPIAISNGGTITALAQDFLRASDCVGLPFSDDLQDLDTAHATEIWAKYINRHTGRRSDAATAYVHSVMDVQTNLYLRTNSRVSRVIFEGTKAVGVAYVPARNRAHQGQLRETIVRARKMVVLSSGTLGTPQILERSGVGSKELLEKLGLKVVSDLPGVGEEYQDHYTTLSIYRVSNESHTLDDFLRGDKEVQKEMRPTEAELKEMGPEFNELWDRYFKDKPDKPVMFGSIVSAAYADHSLLPPGKYITMFQYLADTPSHPVISQEYPASRGKIHISSPDPYKAPFFDSGFMNNKADFAPIRWSYKKTREIARRMDAFRGELTSHHPRFHPASPAACRDIDIRTAKEMLPNGFTVGIHMGTWHKPGDVFNAEKVHEDIVYSEEDDKAIDEWIADHVETTWHSLAMKPREEGGVVDGRLNVFGTENLKCVDLSICPDNLGTNTYSSALLVGEKGASLIAEELGLTIRIPHAPVPHAPIPKGVPATQQVR